MTAMNEISPEDAARVDRFLAEATMFLGPDPEIMRNHKSAPRTPAENKLMALDWDANELDRVRKRIVAGLDEAY